jgi:hypothetical protein
VNEEIRPAIRTGYDPRIKRDMVLQSTSRPAEQPDGMCPAKRASPMCAFPAD